LRDKDFIGFTAILFIEDTVLFVSQSNTSSAILTMVAHLAISHITTGPAKDRETGMIRMIRDDALIAELQFTSSREIMGVL
jgi:hypothetical protein